MFEISASLINSNHKKLYFHSTFHTGGVTYSALQESEDTREWTKKGKLKQVEICKTKNNQMTNKRGS